MKNIRKDLKKLLDTQILKTEFDPLLSQNNIPIEKALKILNSKPALYWQLRKLKLKQLQENTADPELNTLKKHIQSIFLLYK